VGGPLHGGPAVDLTASPVRCLLDSVMNSARFTLGAAIKDATQVAYIPKKPVQEAWRWLPATVTVIRPAVPAYNVPAAALTLTWNGVSAFVGTGTDGDTWYVIRNFDGSSWTVNAISGLSQFATGQADYPELRQDMPVTVTLSQGPSGTAMAIVQGLNPGHAPDLGDRLTLAMDDEDAKTWEVVYVKDHVLGGLDGTLTHWEVYVKA
jgi:hypothetical protein